MIFVAFLWILATKVISHNKEGKVPLYVYYLYKNLDNHSKFLINKIQGTPGNEEKNINNILKELDAKNYCDLFSRDLNLIGEADCNNVAQQDTQEEIIINHYKEQVKFEGNAKIELKIDDKNYTIKQYNNNTYILINDKLYILEGNGSIKKEITNIEFDDEGNLTGEKDNESFIILPFNQLGLKKTIYKDAYTDTIQNTKGEFILSDKPKNKHFRLINNIEIALVLNRKIISKQEKEITPGLSFDVLVEIIMPQIGLDRDKYKTPIIWNDNYFVEAIARNFGSMYVTSYNSTFYITINGTTTTTRALYNQIGKQFKKNNGVMCLNPENCKYYSDGTRQLSLYNWLKMYELTKEYATYDCKMNNQTKKCMNSLFDPETGGYWDFNNYYYVFVMSHFDYPSYREVVTQKQLNFANAKPYYEKWNGFFKNYPCLDIMDSEKSSKSIEKNTTTEEKDEIISDSQDVEYNHFIYTAIDTTFEKGEMDKNIFIFEHFEDKIIPVGYLANNENTPLKFDVITRDPVTFKMKKVNDKPLTYCEAMSYTGEEFSKYCECKDKDEKVITQYEEMKDSSCKNAFGCMIRPVKPSLSGRFK